MKNLFNIKQNNKWGFINTSGGIEIPCEFDYASSYNEGHAIIEIGSRNGIIDTNGNITFVQEELCFEPPSCEVVRFKNAGGMIGLLDLKGNCILNANYDSIEFISSGIAITKLNDMYGIFHIQSSFEVPPNHFGYIGSFNGGIAPSFVGDNFGRYGYINDQGETVIEFKYSTASPFSEDVGIISFDNDLFGVINRKGEITSQSHFELLRPYAEGLAVAAVNLGSEGCIDHFENWIIEPKYKELFSFSDGLAAATIDEDRCKWGFISKKGEWQVKPIFEEVGEFKNGIALVHGEENDDVWSAYIDKYGNFIWGPGQRRY